MGSLCEDQYSFLVLSSSVIGMRNIQSKAVEKVKTDLFSNLFFFSENGAVYEIMWTSIVKATGHR